MRTLGNTVHRDTYELERGHKHRDADSKENHAKAKALCALLEFPVLDTTVFARFRYLQLYIGFLADVGLRAGRRIPCGGHWGEEWWWERSSMWKVE